MYASMKLSSPLLHVLSITLLVLQMNVALAAGGEYQGLNISIRILTRKGRCRKSNRWSADNVVQTLTVEPNSFLVKWTTGRNQEREKQMQFCHIDTIECVGYMMYEINPSKGGRALRFELPEANDSPSMDAKTETYPPNSQQKASKSLTRMMAVFVTYKGMNSYLNLSETGSLIKYIEEKEPRCKQGKSYEGGGQGAADHLRLHDAHFHYTETWDYVRAVRRKLGLEPHKPSVATGRRRRLVAMERLLDEIRKSQ